MLQVEVAAEDKTEKSPKLNKMLCQAKKERDLEEERRFLEVTINSSPNPNQGLCPGDSSIYDDLTTSKIYKKGLQRLNFLHRLKSLIS